MHVMQLLATSPARRAEMDQPLDRDVQMPMAYPSDAPVHLHISLWDVLCLCTDGAVIT